MKPIEQAFLADILASPDDDFPRLAYADWLEEDEQAERAEFIRVQCELASLVEPEKGMCGCPYGSCKQCCYRRQFARHKNSLRRRERELEKRFGSSREWLGIIQGLWMGGLRYEYRRGFIEEITLPLADWQRHGPALVKAAPLRMVRLREFQLVHFSDRRKVFFFSHDPRLIVPAFLDDAVWPTHKTEADALAAMSRCCLEYARNGQNTEIVQA